MAYSENYFKYLEKKDITQNRYTKYKLLFKFIQGSGIKDILEIGSGDNHLVDYLNSE